MRCGHLERRSGKSGKTSQPFLLKKNPSISKIKNVVMPLNGENILAMDWKDKNVFVTGADGFIASWLAKTLVEKSANVTAITRDFRKSPGYKILGIQEKINVALGDIVNYDTIKRVVAEYEIDTCFHLAAQALVQTATRGPLTTFESNIKGTWNILEACRTTETVKRIVVASSDKAYGVQEKLPYTEESPLLGLYPYDASKACTDILARSYFKSYSLPVAVTRNGNTYGGGDLNFSRIIPDTIKSVITGKELLIRSDGTPERDYIYVKDAVNAYLMLAENLDRKEVKGEAFNFGTEKPISVKDLVTKIAQLAGRPDLKPKILGEAKNEIDRQYLDASKGRKLLKWEPKYNLDQGLKETIEWYKKYFSG